ncbi:Probable RNA-directed DNA polymerase from transposon X-element [Anthophora plagiata]
MAKELCKTRGSQNSLTVAKILSSANTGVVEMKPQGFGKLEVTFRTAQQANNFVLNDNAILRPLRAFIPKFRIQRRGIIKNVDIDHDIQEVFKMSYSPCPIIHARRLNRRIRNTETNTTEWVPSETILVTFEGSVLPDSIKLYNLIVTPVEVYVEPPKTCNNCFKFEHTSKFCRSPRICKLCGSTDHHSEECPSSENAKCLHCKGDHRPFNSQCKSLNEQREICKIMAYSNISFWEARDSIIKSNSSTPASTLPPTKTKENFPPLRTIPQENSLKLKALGGQQKPPSTSAWSAPSPLTPSSSDRFHNPASSHIPKPSSSTSINTNTSINNKPTLTPTPDSLLSQPTSQIRNTNQPAPNPPTPHPITPSSSVPPLTPITPSKHSPNILKQGVRTKLAELPKIANNQDIIILTETWLQKNKPFHLNGFSTLRADREGPHGGGVACLIKNSISYQTIPIDNSIDKLSQIIGLQLQTIPKPLNIVAIYRPPDAPLRYQQWKQFVENLSLPGYTIFTGDLNSNHPTWNSERIDNAGSNLLKVILDNNLFVHNSHTKSRLGSPGQRDSNLDVILSTMDIAHLITADQLDEPHGSDHIPITAQILNCEPALRTTHRLSSKKTDWTQFQTNIDSTWSYFISIEYTSLPPLNQYKKFTRILKESVQECTPRSISRTYKHRASAAPWWDSECDRAIRLRKAAFKKWRAFKSRWCQNSPANRLTPNQDTITAAINQIAPPWVPETPPPIPPDNSQSFLNEPFSLVELNYAIGCLRQKAAPGPDGIDNTMINRLPFRIRLILLDLLNDFFRQNLIPPEWLTSHLHFIPKQGGSGLRPINLPTSICKLLGRMLKARLQWWCETKGTLSPTQAGFRKGRSCNDNIGSIVLEANNSIMRGEYTVAAFLDVSRAFDSVHITSLIFKLAEIGISGNTLGFISNWTNNRKAIITPSPTSITTRLIHRGVPQGGVLSPLLFNLYTKDILRHLPSSAKVLQFADDIAIVVTNKNRFTAIATLEDSINSIKDNLNELGLDLSPLKTQFIAFNEGSIQPGSLHLNIGNHQIPNTKVAKFLGIHIDHHLKFESHINRLTSHCMRTLNIMRFLRGTWWGCDPQTLLTIYKSLIRSRLEYGIWWFYPAHHKGLANKIERLQTQEAKLAMGLRFSSPNNAALAEARLPTIRSRAEFLGSKYILKVYAVQDNPVSTHLEDPPPLQTPNSTSSFPRTFPTTNLSSPTAPRQRISLPRGSAACICPQLNRRHDISLNPNASIFTAECAAISAAIDLANENKNYSYAICSDSLSAIQSLNGKPFDSSTNPYIVRTKEGLKQFKRTSPTSSISFMWVPSHKQIQGNELADKAAKEAAERAPGTPDPVPHCDLYPLLQKRMWDQTTEAWLKESFHKGSTYFNTFFSPSRYPWFHNLNIPRYIASWVGRYRSDHYNLGRSLRKIGIVNSPDCPCGFENQDLNHVIWDCPLPPLRHHRRTMLNKLKQHGWKPPLRVEPFIQGINLHAIRIISEFLKFSGLQI